MNNKKLKILLKVRFIKTLTLLKN